MDKQQWLLWGCYLLLCYFPIFYHLDTPGLFQWDESLYALRALSIAENGEYLFNFKQLLPEFDHRNTKPPFITLFQALSLKMLGYNELALRLPIALLVLSLCFYLPYWTKRTFNSFGIGMLSMLVLLTSIGFVRTHVARTGDHDAAISIFLFLSMLLFYRMVHAATNKETARATYLFAIVILMGTLTKSIVAFMFLPVLAVYAIAQGKLVYLLRLRSTYISIGIVLAGIVAYYGWLEAMKPGYLMWIWEYDLGGRYTNTIEQHSHPFKFYFDLLFRERFHYWLWFLPISLLIPWIRKSEWRNLSLLSFFCALFYLLVVSASETKLHWYDAPAYIPLALVVGIGVYELWRGFSELSTSILPANKSAILTVVFVFTFFGAPYHSILQAVNWNLPNNSNERYGFVLRRVLKDYPAASYKVLHSSFSIPLGFYSNAWTDEKKEVLHIQVPEGLKTGDVVLTGQAHQKAYLTDSIAATAIYEAYRIKVFRID